MRYGFFAKYLVFPFLFFPLSILLLTGIAYCLELRSGAFEGGGNIPARYTCLGENVSPGLSWSGVPAGAQSFVLIMDDPDAPAGTWVHWVIYDILKDAGGLKENVPKRPVLADGARQGMNSFRRVEYGGPCPPPGPAHRYVFTLYALDVVLGLAPGASKETVMRGMKGHILGKATLTGMFGR